MSRPQCKGCLAVIRWIRTAAGKAMPVDPEFLSEWVVDHDPKGLVEPHRRITLLSGDGKRMETGYQCSVLTPGARHIEGFIPHWGTCPHAKDFKKPAEPNPWKGEQP